MKNRFVITLGLSSLLLASTALAQDASVTVEKENLAPAFATMDRGDANSKIGLAATMTIVDQSDTTALRFDMHGQYVHKKGYGAYGALPFTHLSTSFGPGSEYSEVALGNLEAGGLYNMAINKDTTLTLRGGIVLPTGDDGDGQLSNLINMFPRLTDISNMFGNTTVARASASVSGKQGKFFYRADGGIDVAIDTPDMMDLDPLVRFNMGVGMHTGPVALMGELVTVGTTGDVDAEEDRFLHTAALSATFTQNKKLQPMLSVIVPVNSSIRKQFDASVMVGLQGRLP